MKWKTNEFASKKNKNKKEKRKQYVFSGTTMYVDTNGQLLAVCLISWK